MGISDDRTRRTLITPIYAGAMWLRRTIYRWVFPAAIVLPLWLLIGWGVFQAGGWAFLWVLFVAMPSVCVAQLGLALLVRARPSVRERAAVSTIDAVGFIVWHGLVIAVGCYIQGWFAALLLASILVVIGLYVLALRQLRAEVGTVMMRSRAEYSSSRGETSDPSRVIIVRDADPDPRDEPRR